MHVVGWNISHQLQWLGCELLRYILQQNLIPQKQEPRKVGQMELNKHCHLEQFEGWYVFVAKYIDSRLASTFQNSSVAARGWIAGTIN